MSRASFGENFIDNGVNQSWNGEGLYSPFSGEPGRTNSPAGQLLSGGGGGGAYVAPTPTNPTYVPPSFNTNGIIKISLLSDENVSHTENDEVIGIGKNVSKAYTIFSFGQTKTYKANLDGKIPLNYYVVSIEKKFNASSNLIDVESGTPSQFDDVIIRGNQFTRPGRVSSPINNLNFGGNSKDFLANRFSEVVSVKEYELGTNNQYTFLNERKYEIKNRDAFGNLAGSDNIVVDLQFKFKEGKVETPISPNTELQYTVLFAGNYASEIGDKVTLSYDLVSNSDDTLIKNDKIKLSDTGNDPEKIQKVLLDSSTFKFRIDGVLPGNYSVKSVYYTTKPVPSGRQLSEENDFATWTQVSTIFDVPGKELASDLNVYVFFDKEIQKTIPLLSLPQNVFTYEVRDSDNDKIVIIPFNTTDADTVDVYFESGKINKVNASDGRVVLSFKNDFSSKFGVQKVKLVANNTQFATISNGLSALINFQSVDNFPSIIQTTAPKEIDIPSFSDFNIEYEVMYKSTDASSVDIDLLLKDKTRVTLYKNTVPDNKIKINLKQLGNTYPNWNGSDNVTLIIRPYNRGGEKELVGNEYTISTKIKYPTISLDETLITKAIYDAFYQNLKIDEPEKESKYLSHLLNFDNDERVLISSYEEDNWTLSEKEEDELGNIKVKKEVQSVILRLYTPLPPNFNVNDTLWITKLITNPLIETVVLNEQDEKDSPFIKGPNFDIDIDFVKGNSTNYESLDNLIISASSSTNLIQKYLSGSSISAEDLNIEYASGSITSSSAQYIWENFVHFSSAEERINNFVYKLQLIEGYEDLIVSASTDYTSGGSAAWTASLAAQQEVDRQKAKKSALIQGFDGFETFLYTSSSMYTTATSSSITWPYSSSVRLKTTNTEAIGWYNNIIQLANSYDNQNPNYLINNIPQYITTNDENLNFILFFSMIGHHFDTIYFYTKAIEKSRGFGYKNKNGVSDKLLFDYLKSFNWDAKNLGTSVQLWDYVYGEDINGTPKVTIPVKERTNEVWRRIINNLPYLLKHRGTRRGIHALMACYGIPSSNLSIIEFGGPEPTEDSISKLLIDDKSYALNFESNSGISIPWVNTTQNRKPDTIEVFVKPAYSGEWLVFGDGNGFTSGVYLSISGSPNSKYGKIKFYDTNTHVITSSLLPLFNDRFIGICVSRTITGSNQNIELNVIQVDGDREIFSSFTSGSYVTAASVWDIATVMHFGEAGEPIDFSGSFDEIRLWSTPLSRSRFEEHVYYPEMINGNSISSSTADLHFRLDFEYPKNINSSSFGINVAPTIHYSSSYTRNDYEDGLAPTSSLYSTNPSASFIASFYGFSNSATYPYQFSLIDRNCILEIPSLGASRYSTNKVRFSSQSLVADLSVNSKSTLNSFEYAPIDSNRVGVFVSPMKELNFDIAKSIGSNNLDDYIGDPSDLYNDSYRDLNKLKNYYFERVKNRDIYEYINIIKSYEKAMFDDIKDMLPARVKATTGLLIEPHFLERSKYKHQKPTGSDYYNESEIDASTHLQSENNQYENKIDIDTIFLNGDNNQYESTIDSNNFILLANNNQYDSEIDTYSNLNTIAESNQYETNLETNLSVPSVTPQNINFQTNTILDKNLYEDVGFSTYFENGYAIRNYYDRFGVLQKERVVANLIVEEVTESFLRYAQTVDIVDSFGVSKSVGDPRGGFVETSIVVSKSKLVVQPFTTNPMDLPMPWPSNDIISVSPVDGYLPTHYKFVGDLTVGLQNSYYKGSKNTAGTTLDGSSPVEVFISNPNAIKVLPGKNINEPIIKSDN